MNIDFTTWDWVELGSHTYCPIMIPSTWWSISPLTSLDTSLSVGELSIHDKITFNVGGHRFDTYSKTIVERLGEKWLTCVKDSSARVSSDEYFIDRNPTMFSCILDYCRTGHLHLPHNICGPFVTEEMMWWNVSPDIVQPCCWSPFTADDQQRHAGLIYMQLFANIIF